MRVNSTGIRWEMEKKKGEGRREREMRPKAEREGERETIEVLEENMPKFLFNLSIGKGFLVRARINKNTHIY